MTDTKRSNAEIADELKVLLSVCPDELIREAAAALREPITFSDAAVEAGGSHADNVACAW